MNRTIAAAGLTFFMLFLSPALAVEKSTPANANQEVAAGRMILIDIRRPDEWAATGVAQSARPMDMRDQSFISRVQAIAKANPDKKIALICRTGVRSKRMSSTLEGLGLDNIVDVVGGMKGNSSNSGWIAQGLPLRQK
jgi:rhodanese-related sulfurtransferase